ncbi:MAG: ZIP family metal transporter [Thermoplasmata archaeon]
MSELTTLLILSSLAGAAIPVGGLFAYREHLKVGPFRMGILHFLVAFGGGVVLSAVALVLVPLGLEAVTLPEAVVSFSMGALVFLAIDRAVQMRGQMAGQSMSLVADYIPESLALGAAFAAGGPLGPLLAFLIGTQNLPEGFNSFRELKVGGRTGRRCLAILGAVALMGPAAALLGFLLLGGQPRIIGWLFLFAAGGILFTLFQDVAPLAHHEGQWVPTLGAVAGFLLGIVGEVLIASL